MSSFQPPSERSGIADLYSHTNLYSLQMNTVLLTNILHTWSTGVLEIGRYTIPEILFVPKFHTGTYQYELYPFTFFHF
jgi:hypothetical protein